jgi:ribosomal protein L22
MTPEKPTDEQVPESEAQAKSEAKAAAAKKPAAEKTPDTAKPAAVKKAAAKKSVEAEGTGAEVVAAAKPARAPKVSAEKPAAKKAPDSDAGEVESVAEGGLARVRKAPAKKPAAEKASTAKAEEPDGAKAEKPAATARRDAQAAASTPRRKVVRAHARYVRTSARKARMVCGHLRGKSVGEARAILAFTPREVARDWSKLLESAVANAENNHELVEDDLFVGEAFADEGPTIKRFRPRAQGRAAPIRKRTSHLTITLTPKP